MATCIFCGQPGSSREHLWSQWSEDLVPTDEGTYTFNSSHLSYELSSGQSTHSKAPTVKRNRDLSTLSAYAICETCNNGWMSRMENAAAPILTSMIKDEACLISRSEQQSLARWITLKALVGESLRGQRMPGPTPHPQFYKWQEPFKDTQIYVSRLPVGNLRRERQAALIGARMPDGTTQRIGQWVVLQLGTVYMVYIEAHQYIVDLFQFSRAISHRFDRVFPYPRSSFHWPPPYSLDLDTLQDLYAELEAWSGISKAMSGLSVATETDAAAAEGSAPVNNP